MARITRLRARASARRRGFTLIELIVAMAVLAILAIFATSIYSAQIAQAHTHNAVRALDQLNTALAAYQAYQPSSCYPASDCNASGLTDGTDNGGATAYAALQAALQTVGVNNLPDFASIFNPDWDYVPNNGSTPVPTYTITTTAVSGTGHVLCADPVNGVVDLGTGANAVPAQKGVKCK
jgi:prepilin-type N-terminal cleavage/methylation domain-containing protein